MDWTGGTFKEASLLVESGGQRASTATYTCPRLQAGGWEVSTFCPKLIVFHALFLVPLIVFAFSTRNSDSVVT